jgi:glycosyltransferase involved in cell wall biosynthesis
VAVNYGGPAEIVDEEVGHLLPADGPESVIVDLVRVFRDAFHNPKSWQVRGLAGRHRAESRYGWEAKIDEALKMYRSVQRAPARQYEMTQATAK